MFRQMYRKYLIKDLTFVNTCVYLPYNLHKHNKMRQQKQISSSDNLRQRILNIRPQLPRRYTRLMIDADGKLRGLEKKIRRVVALQLVDENITSALEKFVKSIN